MNFIEELRWRGMLHDMTPGADEYVTNQKVTGYIGFDPTAPSMTIGNFVQIMILKLFQLSGHTPIVLMGGATGRIGDPSFKENERDLKSYDELDNNLSFQIEQVKKFLDFDGPNPAKIVNNLDFYKNMNVLDFLRDVGKTLTVSYMMSKDSVKNRLETGLSFTEFSYQLLQAYDFQLLYNEYQCKLQMGGSDQWGNITSGTEFIRRNCEGKAYAITTPLLTKADGTKFGKSEQGNIWLDPKLTSPYQFYQFWLNADDADVSKYLRFFSLKSHAEIEALEAMISTDPRAVKAVLAEELTERVHSINDVIKVKRSSELFYIKDSADLQETDFEIMAETYTTIEIPPQNELEKLSGHEKITYSSVGGIPIYDLLVNLNIFNSKNELRMAIKNNALSINKVKVSSYEKVIKESDYLFGKYIMVENGKHKKFLLVNNIPQRME